MPNQLTDIEARLANAVTQPASGKVKMLKAVIAELQKMRKSIATTPELS